MLGVADAFTIVYVNLLSKYFTKIIYIVNFVMVITIVLSLLFIFLQDLHPIIVPIGIVFLRLQMASLQNYGNHINLLLFPAEYRSLASGTMNFIGRGFKAFAVIFVEYTNQPVVYVLGLSVGVLFTLGGLISEP